MALHSKELKKKYRVDTKIRHTIRRGFCQQIASSQKLMSSRKPLKRQASKSRSLKSSARPNTTAASSISRPTTSNGKINCRTPDYYGFQSSVCSVSDQESIPAFKRPRPANPVIKTVIQEKASQPPLIETSFQLSILSPLDSRIQPIGTTPPEEYDYADYDLEVIMSVFDAEYLKLFILDCAFHLSFFSFNLFR